MVGQPLTMGARWPHGDLARVHYPSELGPDLFIGHGRRVRGTLFRLLPHACAWDEETSVEFAGTFSPGGGESVCYGDGDHPMVPGNRFLDVAFGGRGPHLGSRRLTCQLVVDRRVHGDGRRPWVVIRVTGHHDAGRGRAAEYGFTLHLSTNGEVRARRADRTVTGVVVGEDRGTPVVRLPVGRSAAGH
jgi:hypothetical protein